MATLFLDFENGNDNYGGTSFALLASGVDGTIVTATFTSATASFPNDGSLIGQYLSIFNGTIYALYNITAWVSATSLTIAAISGGTALANQAARQYYIGGRWKNITTGATAVRTVPGDTIRIKESPAPTSLGQNGVWTSQALPGLKFINSSTNTTPISISCTTHGYSTGDTVIVAGHPTNTNANGTWEITNTGANTFTLNGSVGNGVGPGSGTVRLRNNVRVMLTTPVTQNIASTGFRTGAWVASTNCNHAFNTAFFKENTNSDAITVTTAFTTGKAAYYTLPATLDLSSYQQVSFWIFLSGDDLLATEAELRLCSDTTGDTVVDTVPIPYTPAGRFRVVTWDKGSALGSSIASISLFINTDLSTTANVALIFSNIIACKASSAADSLTLSSLIGKNTTGETFWGIQSINGTRVMLDSDTNNAPAVATARGYYGTSETVTTWKRETIKLGPAVATFTNLQTIQESGTDGNPITYSGGWDQTNMSTQTLETWLDGVNGNGVAILSSQQFVNLSNIAGVRLYHLNNGTMPRSNWDIIAYNNGTGGCLDMGSSANNLVTATIRFGCAGIAAPVRMNGGSNLVLTVGKILSINSNGLDISTRGETLSINALDAGSLIANCNGSGISGVAQFISNLRMQANTQNSVGITNASFYTYAKNCLFDDATEVSVGGLTSAVLFSQNHDQVSGNHKIFVNGALISSATDQRKTASGISWKMQPTSTDRSSTWPVILSLAKVACSANNLVTIKAWMYRDNAGLTMRLVCKGGQLAGVASDVVSALSTTGAWEEETITFTPTETGVVEITAEAWGGTTFSGWVDDMTISQA